MSYLTLKNVGFSVISAGEPKNILQELNLSVAQGEFVVILGGNGAGKSTFFNVLDGTLQPTSGVVELNDEDIKSLSLKKRALKIARVYQDPKQGTAPRMTVAENLLLAENVGHVNIHTFVRVKKEMARLKEIVAQSQNGLEDVLNNPTELLSGGQRQALSLFMATSQTPELLLLDEHTAALDVLSAKKIMALTQQIVTEKNLTCLMITHDLEDALTFGDRLVVLKAGKIAADFSKSEKDQLTKEDLFSYFY
ncbi:ABC transporter ATP-binding protein [Enterococcus timonensis]|uniref:ABC transporter ATP-binding protein n=1 Tax=Enterococcus timonensis TaxID=1852364 RepID=UPI0008D95199|nr:ATP-binding cassette domain-containing protein [Enterococcus timonensis]